MRYALVLFTLLLLFSACSPLAITSIKASEGCLTWQTNQEAQCKITYCEGTLCYTSPIEPDYGTLHCYSLPVGAKDITITAIGRNGQTCSIEVK